MICIVSYIVVAKYHTVVAKSTKLLLNEITQENSRSLPDMNTKDYKTKKDYHSVRFEKRVVYKRGGL